MLRKQSVDDDFEKKASIALSKLAEARDQALTVGLQIEGGEESLLDEQE